ncbi:selT/selW/selH selenoprotein family protein [Campylobacter iguaniorum]|uniref:SelT/selW/selH selenoprotein family protein n=1 Tax=Campylobacter iguaniorum TaxID=1244531 RepID=A0A076FA68_9BACT|nr:Rdx family protein [Campylobacter iguaniorum]AII15105.1 selT/selW/selH selenoprotein family protein [Campylobacter iguaniorum]ALV24972.1 selT/selW/selH selenoprotein family protein [Campylobacter iguaniorum]
MNVKITYCSSCSQITAESVKVENELKKSFPDANITRVPGEKGNFTVEADGKKVYDYNGFTRPRFPEVGEVGASIIKEFDL